jgi:ribosome-associated translation inhibitor RaiA
MQIDIQARQFSLTEALRNTVEAEARQYEADFADRLHSLNVRLFDVNGTKGGIDKGCLLFARIGRGQATVVASGIDSDMYRAIAAAFSRLARGTRHSLDRNRRVRRPGRGAAAAPTLNA